MKKHDLKLMPLDDLKKVVGGLVAVPKPVIEKRPAATTRRKSAKKPSSGSRKP